MGKPGEITQFYNACLTFEPQHYIKPVVEVRTHNPSTQEMEAEGSKVNAILVYREFEVSLGWRPCLEGDGERDN